jgi:tetratricopeptide (TPR) repeat protein
MSRPGPIPALVLGFAILAVLAFAPAALAGSFEQGKSLFAAGQYKTAAEKLENAVEDDPGNLEALRLLGDSYYNLFTETRPEYADKAIKAYKAVLESDPDDGRTRLRLAQVYSWIEDSDNAIKQLEILIKKEPDSTTAMAELAEIYSWKPETFNEALDQVDAILKIDSKHVRARMIGARVLSWKQEYEKSLTHYEALLDQDPENDDLRLEYANTLTLAGRFDDAVVQFNYLSLRDKNRDQSLLGLAQAYYYAKRYDDALAVTDVVLKKEPKNALAWRLKGLIYAERRMVNEAVECFHKALEIDPNDIEARTFLARAYAMNDATYPEAVAAYQEVLKSQPDNVELRAELARLHAYANNYPQAIKEFRALVEQFPDDIRHRMALIQALSSADEHEAAVEESKNLLKIAPDDLQVRLLIGEVLVKAGLFEDAIDHYKDILDDHRDNMDAMIGLGWAHHMYSLDRANRAGLLEKKIQAETLAMLKRIKWLYYRMGELWHFNRAVATLGRTADKHAGSPEPHLKLAEVYAGHKAYKSAIESYEKALKNDPRNVDAYLGMAWVYGEMDDHQKSIDAIRQAAQIYPSNVDVLRGLGDAYAYQQDVSQAIEAIEKAVAIQYSDLELHRRLAALYSQSSKYYEKATQECEYILKQDPTDDETRLLMARVLSWDEKYDESARVYEELHQRQPEDRDLYLEMMRTKVHSVRSDEVIAELRQMLEEKPEDIDARIALAYGYETRNDYDLAEQEYLKILKAEPKNGEAHLGLAGIYREREEYDRAVIEYREVLSTNPDSAQAYYGFGIIDRRNARYERAIAMQEKVLELDPTNANALAELSYNHYLLSRRYIAHTGQYHRAWWLLTNSWGDVYGVFGEYPANIVQMKAILSEDPGNCDLRFLLAQILQEHGRNQEAVVEYRKVLKYCPNHIGTRVALADIYSYSPSTYAWAIQQTQEIIKTEPDNYDAHLRLARLYAWSLHYNASVGQYAWCLKKKPDSVDVRYELAQTLTFARRFDDAIAQYEMILEQSPERDDVRMEIAKLFSNSNRNDLAIREYEVILKRNPNHYEASYALASLYSWDRRYYHRAADLYRYLLDRQPDNPDVQIAYAKLLYETGEYSQAEKALRDSIDMGQGGIEAHLMLGRLYVAQRQNENAISEFKEVLKLDPDNIDAHFHLAEIYATSEDTYDMAIKHGLTVLKYEPKNEEIRGVVARLSSYQEDYLTAAEHFRILHEQEPDSFEYLLGYATNLSFAEKYDQAVVQFEKAMEKKPNDAELRLELGLAHLAVGAYMDAIVNLEFVAENDPWNIRARRGLARSYKGAGQTDAAITEYKRILVIDPNDQEAKEYLAGYDIEYVKGAFLDDFFSFPGKTMWADGKTPTGAPVLSEAEKRYRVRLAEELLMNNRVKRARYVYEDLVESDPENAYYHLSLANLYAVSNMWSSAEKEYNTVLAIDPANESAVVGLAKVAYASSPTLDAFVGIRDGERFGDRVTSYWAGSRFTYRFWDGSEAFGELTGARHTQDQIDDIDRLSALVGLRLGLFGELTFLGQYIFNAYDRIDPTQEFMAALSYNFFDTVGLEGFYQREDVRQTLVAMEEDIQKDDLGGTVRIWPLYRLTIRGHYRYSWITDSDLIDENDAQLLEAGIAYTFFNGPYFLVGYGYSHLTFDSEQPGQVGAYWSPERYQAHSIPLELYGDATKTLMYKLGLVPTYGIVDPDQVDNFGMYAFGGLDWQMALKHKLALDVGSNIGLEGDYFDYSALLDYTYIFGKHEKLWE